MNHKFYGKVKDGKLTLDDEGLYHNHLHTLEGDVEVVVGKRRNTRTMRQNSYYWGVVIRMIADDTGNSAERVHEAMKHKFLKTIIKMKGEDFESAESTTSLDTGEFSKDYVDQIKMWARDFLGVEIPEATDVYF